MPRSRFTTSIKKYSINSEPLVFPIRFGPAELNKTIKNLLKDNDIDISDINFNFFINGELLTVSLEEFIASKKISEEIEEIVYDIDLQPPNLESETKTEQFITGMKFRSKWLAVASSDVSIFDTSAPSKPIVFLQMDTAMSKLDWISLNADSNEAVLIAGGEWNKLAMYRCDLSSGAATQLFEYRGHQKNITSISVAPDSSAVASGSEDGILKIWSASRDESDLCAETGGIPHVRKNPTKVPTRIPLVTIEAHSADVCDLQWLHSPLDLPSEVIATDAVAGGAGTLLSCGNDRYLKLWHVGGDRTEASLVREVKGATCMRLMAASEAGNRVLVGSADNRLRCYDLRARAAETHNIMKAHAHCLTGLRWLPGNGNTFLSSCRAGVTKLWDIRSAKAPLAVVSNFGCSVSCLEVSEDGQWIANAYVDGALRFYKFPQ